MRWTRPESWHLTLLFVGSVPPDQVDRLAAVCDAVVEAVDGPFRVRVDHGGGRTRGGDGVAWLELSDGADRLLAMAQEAFERYPADVTPDRPPKLTPSAHLTVARRADEAVIGDLRTARHGPLGVGWTLDRVQLVRSHLDRGGATYETLHERSL